MSILERPPRTPAPAQEADSYTYRAASAPLGLPLLTRLPLRLPNITALGAS